MSKKKSEQESKVVELKLKRPHPQNKFRLQGHVITNVWQKFELSDEEVKELASAGCQHWIAVKEA